MSEKELAAIDNEIHEHTNRLMALIIGLPDSSERFLAQQKLIELEMWADFAVNAASYKVEPDA